MIPKAKATEGEWIRTSRIYGGSLRLDNEEYAALAAEAQRTGESVEALVHAALRARYQPAQPAEIAKSGMSQQEFLD